MEWIRRSARNLEAFQAAGASMAEEEFKPIDPSVSTEIARRWSSSVTATSAGRSVPPSAASVRPLRRRLEGSFRLQSEELSLAVDGTYSPRSSMGESAVSGSGGSRLQRRASDPGSVLSGLGPDGGDAEESSSSGDVASDISSVEIEAIHSRTADVRSELARTRRRLQRLKMDKENGTNNAKSYLGLNPVACDVALIDPSGGNESADLTEATDVASELTKRKSNCTKEAEEILALKEEVRRYKAEAEAAQLQLAAARDQSAQVKENVAPTTISEISETKLEELSDENVPGTSILGSSNCVDEQSNDREMVQSSAAQAISSLSATTEQQELSASICAEIQAKEEEIIKLLSSLESARVDMEKVLVHCHGLEEENAILIQALQTATSKLKRSSTLGAVVEGEEEEEENEDESAGAQESKEENGGEKARSDAENGAGNSAVAAMSHEAAPANEDVAQLVADLGVARSDMQTLLLHCQSLENENHRLSGAFQCAQEMTSQMAAVHTELTAAEQRITALEEENRALKRANSELHGEDDDDDVEDEDGEVNASVRLAAALQCAHEMTSQMAAVQTELSAAELRVASLEEENTALREKIANGENQDGDSDGDRLAAALQCAHEMTSQMAGVQTELSSALKRVSALEEENQLLREATSAAIEENDEVEDESGALVEATDANASALAQHKSGQRTSEARHSDVAKAQTDGTESDNEGRDHQHSEDDGGYGASIPRSDSGDASQSDYLRVAMAVKKTKRKSKMLWKKIRNKSESHGDATLDYGTDNEGRERDRRIEDLERVIIDSDGTISDLKSELTQLRSSSKADEYKKQQTIGELQKKNAEMRAKAAQLERDLGVAEAEREEAVGEVEESLRAEIQSLKDEKEQLETAFCEVRELLAEEHAMEVEDLRSKLECRETTISSLERSLLCLRQGAFRGSSKEKSAKKGHKETSSLTSEEQSTSEESYSRKEGASVGHAAGYAGAITDSIDVSTTDNAVESLTAPSMEEQLALQLKEREEVIAELRGKVALLERRQSEIAPAVCDADINSQLQRVTNIQKHAVVSIELLYKLAKRLKKIEDNCKKDEDEMQVAMKLAEKASLVQKELEVSLRYIELRLRNKLESVASSNGKREANNGAGNDSAPAVLDFDQITRIQMEALTMLRESEDDILEQIDSLKDQVQSVDSENRSLRITIKKLEEAAGRKEKALNALRAELSGIKAEKKADADILAELQQTNN